MVGIIIAKDFFSVITALKKKRDLSYLIIITTEYNFTYVHIISNFTMSYFLER